MVESRVAWRVYRPWRKATTASPLDNAPGPIEQAIAALEAQRPLLGDAVVDLAIGPLREKLAADLARQRAGEQRLKMATVLFADVVGSTRLSQSLDPEDVHAVLDSTLVRLTEIVQQHHGRILQYAGDGLLAVFGADQSLEDDVERGVRSGLAMVAEAPALRQRFLAEFGFADFDLRVGIHTGQVLLGGGVDGIGSIRGTTVNIAARMEQSAPAGGLRITHDTYRHVRGVFEVARQAPILVKGIAEAVRSYLVLSVRPRAFRVPNRGLEGIETRMVGRDAELARLVESYETVAEEGTLAMATIVGEAGLGKSRLLSEFAQWLALRPLAPRIFQGRPRPYGNNLPYGLLRDILAWQFDILDGDPQATAQDKLARGLGAVLGERVDEHVALIGQLIGLDYHADPHIAGIAGEARQLRDRAFYSLTQYFCAVQRAAGAPIVFLLDDLHWADEGSLDLVNHLATSLRELPMVGICLTRPVLFERRPLWGRGQSDHQRIDLLPLSKRGSRELVEALLSRLESVPAALRDLLTSSAEGNPYFVEELVGMLIDDGVIDAVSEPWRVVADKLLDVHVPSTLAGVLQARIDGLPSAEKTALQQASVVGHVFWDEALQRIGTSEPEALESLMRRELTFGRETTAFEGAREYVFKHHVLHQVAYDSVLKASKREHHRQTADWLVVRSGDRASEYFGLIADHYERAGDAANAVVYLGKAAEDAARGYVHAAALDYVNRALSLVPAGDAEARFELLLTRRKVYANTGRRVEQEADVTALEQLAEQLDDNVRRARAGSLRAAQALLMADYPGASAAAERAVGWAEAANARGAALLAHINWARALQFQGDFVRAQERTERSLALAREVGDRRIEASSLGQLGILAFSLGRYGVDRGYFKEALALARSIGDRALESGMINNLGDAERRLGNYAAAFELFQSGRRVSREIGQRMAEGYLLCNMAYVAFLRGDAAEAVTLSHEAHEHALALKDRDLEAVVLCTRAHAQAGLGQADDAAEGYARSVAIYRELGRPTMPPEPLAGLARLALGRGALDAARGHIDEIVAHLDGGGSVDGTEDPLWIFLTCHHVLAAAEHERSAEFLRHAHGVLMERAAALADTERESFLGQVPSHRAIVTAWSAAGIAPAGV